MGSVWHAQSPEVGKVLRTYDVFFETPVQIQPSLIRCCNTLKQINPIGWQGIRAQLCHLTSICRDFSR